MKTCADVRDNLIEVRGLADLDGIRHAFEMRNGRLARRLPAPLARLQQVHGADVRVIGPSADLTPFQDGRNEARPAADAFITARHGVTLAVATADCAPVLVADPRAGVVAAVHAGWRGIAIGVIPATIEAMATRLRANPGDCVVAIGPCVSALAYRVDDEVIDAFAKAGINADIFSEQVQESTEDGTRRTGLCDLTAAARQQLVDAGVPPGQVYTVNMCTFGNAKHFHSYRRDGDAAGRMLAGIALTD